MSKFLCEHKVSTHLSNTKGYDCLQQLYDETDRVLGKVLEYR